MTRIKWKVVVIGPTEFQRVVAAVLGSDEYNVLALRDSDSILIEAEHPDLIITNNPRKVIHLPAKILYASAATDRATPPVFGARLPIVLEQPFTITELRAAVRSALAVPLAQHAQVSQ
jgi:hypothetical protein